MTNPDARPGTLPGYLPQKEAAMLAGQPIGQPRLLSITEEGDMLAAGLDRGQIAGMTPEALAALADSAIDQSELFIGP